MTIDPFGILQHTEQETRLAEHAVLFWAIYRQVSFGTRPERQRVVICLQQTVRVRIRDVCLETAMLCLIIKSGKQARVSAISDFFRLRVLLEVKVLSEGDQLLERKRLVDSRLTSTPNLEYLISTLR